MGFQFNILEETQDVISLIRYLDNLVTELRDKGILQKYPSAFKVLREYYEGPIPDFLERYDLAKEVLPKSIEVSITDDLLDLISTLQSIKSL